MGQGAHVACGRPADRGLSCWPLSPTGLESAPRQVQPLAGCEKKAEQVLPPQLVAVVNRTFEACAVPYAPRRCQGAAALPRSCVLLEASRLGRRVPRPGQWRPAPDAGLLLPAGAGKPRLHARPAQL
jgi:hypothetical protein